MVLGAALMHAVWNALLKSGADRVASMGLISAVWTVAGGLLVLYFPAPLPESWLFLAISVGVHFFYQIGLLLMYSAGDLSHVYPIARGSAPLVLAGLAAAIMGEVLTPWKMLGVAAISLGILSLALERGWPAPGHRRAVLFALLTGAAIVLYTLADGVGVRSSGSSHGYASWLFFIQGWPYLAVFAFPSGGRPGLLRKSRFPRGTIVPGVVAGLLSMGGYWVVIWAYNLVPLAPIAALRETGVIFAALIGTLILGEPFGKWRMVAAASVACGVALLNLPL